MPNIRAWYEHPDNEPLRREVKWFWRWFWKWGWIFVIVLGCISFSLDPSFLINDDHSYRIEFLLIRYPWLNLQILYDLALCTQTVLLWGVWLFLLSRRTFPWLKEIKRNELALWPQRPVEVWPWLLATPILWCATATAALTLLRQAIILLFPSPWWGYFAHLWIDNPVTRLISSAIRECVTLFYVAAITLWTAWSCLARPDMVRAALLCLGGGLVYYVADNLWQSMIVNLFPLPAFVKSIPLDILICRLLSAIPEAGILYFIARYYWRKLTSPETRERLLNAR